MLGRWMGISAFSLLIACQTVAPAGEDALATTATVAFADAGTHEAAGLAVAEADYPGLRSLCGEPSRELNLERVQANTWRMPDAVPPARVFENLYFVGNSFSSAWVVQTSGGLILIDALMNGEEAARDIEGGLQALGLDPADIRYLIISHGHGDHSGGAAYLGEKYGPQVVMSRFDWEMSQDPERGIQLPGWNDVPEPSVLVEGEYELTLGNTTITLVETPGHTMGTVSTILAVQDGGSGHKAVIWGGTGFNFGPVLDQYRAYAQSAENMRQRVLDEGIEIFLSNHVARDATDLRIAALTERANGSAHPFVSDPQTVSRAFVVFRECALKQGAVLLQSQVNQK